MNNQGIFNSDNVEKGVFIFTENGNYILPKFWGLYESKEKPVGAAIIADKKLLVALNGSDGSLELLEWGKDLKGKKYDSWDESLKDDQGKETTAELAAMDSAAASFCNDYENGQVAKGNWYMPTNSEMQFMYDHKKDLDIALAIAGGNPIETDDWHWTATRRYDKSHWIFHWYNGDRNNYIQYIDFRVRPVSAFLSSL